MQIEKLHPVLNDLLSNKIPVTVVWDEKEQDTAYTVPGFYKCGSMKLFLRDGGYMESVDRYGDKERINDFMDLLELNLDWWERANGYNINGDIPIAEQWQEALLEYDLVTKTPIIRWRRTKYPG